MGDAAPGTKAYFAKAAGTELLWIGGLSILHNIAIHFYGVTMMLGLGVQAEVNMWLWASGGVSNRMLAMGSDVALAAPFLVAGLLARFGVTIAIPIALVLYVADAGVVVWILTRMPRDLMMTLALLFHGYMAYSVFTRWKYIRQAPATAA